MTVAADDLADISWFTNNRDPTHPGQHGQAAGRIDVGLSIHRHIGLGLPGMPLGMVSAKNTSSSVVISQPSSGLRSLEAITSERRHVLPRRISRDTRLHEREPNDAVLVPGGPIEAECATTVMQDQHDVVDVEVVHQRVEVALVITEAVLTVWSSRVTVANEVNSART